jgi:hypothetical protein
LFCCNFQTEMIFTAHGTHVHSVRSEYDHRFVPTIIKVSCCVLHVAFCNFLLYTVQLPAYSIFVLINVFSRHHQCLEWLIWVAKQQTGAWQCNTLIHSRHWWWLERCLNSFVETQICWQLDYIQQKIIKTVDQECEQASWNLS